MADTTDSESEWESIFAGLTVAEAVLLPGIDEAGGNLRQFQLSPRSTIHVRHRAKYVDVQLIEGQGFVFTDSGKPMGPPARTLNEFVSSLKTLPLSILDGHARRGDFSQWIAEVFHDHVLASDVRKVEQRYRLGHTRDLYNALADAIGDRYEVSRNAEETEEESPLAIAT